MDYSIQLMDKKKFSPEECRLIEQRYNQALVQQFGNSAEVARSRRAWVQAKTRQDEMAGADISLEEKQAIVHWERPEAAARLLALEGYTGALEDLYIDVRVESAP